MQLRLRDRTIDCDQRTAVMGILNVSDDSPVAFSRVGPGDALERAREMTRQGAEIIDVGAHSTATGAREVPPQEEIERVVPVIEALVGDGLVASVDTWTAKVARAAAEAGVHLLNDVTGFRDEAMVQVAIDHGIPGCVMHLRGEPKHHREVEQGAVDLASEVIAELEARAIALEARGAQVWLDPGFGFGRSAEDNAALLRSLPGLVAVGRPVLVSASRKGFLAELSGRDYSQDTAGLLEATVSFNVLASLCGAHVVRVHDVEPVTQALAVTAAVRGRPLP